MRFPRLGLNNAVTLDRVTASFADQMPTPSALPYGSPYASDSLARIVFEDVVGKGVVPPPSRAQAMRNPTVARGRNLMVSTICRWPLVALDGDQRLPDEQQPAWAYSTAGPTHPSIRLAWTVDDLIFYGFSLWSRNLDGSPGARINKSRWRFDGDGHIYVDDILQRGDQVILFCGLHEGILEYGVEVLNDARALYRNVRQRLKNPSPQLMLQQTDGPDMDDDAIDKLILRWAKAREGENGGVGFANKSIKVEELGGGDPQLMIEARNAMAVDIARVIGLSASKVDATAPKASLNYETTEGRNQEFVDTDVDLYVTPIVARLSMDDIVPAGIRIALDNDDFTTLDPSPTGPGVQD